MSVKYIPNASIVKSEDDRVVFRVTSTQAMRLLTGSLYFELVNYNTGVVLDTYARNNYTPGTTISTMFGIGTIPTGTILYIRCVFNSGSDTFIAISPALDNNNKYFPTFCFNIRHTNKASNDVEFEIHSSQHSSFPSNVKVTYKIGSRSISLSTTSGIPETSTFSRISLNEGSNISDVVSVTVEDRSTGTVNNFLISFVYWCKYSTPTIAYHVIVSDLLCEAQYADSMSIYESYPNAFAVWARGLNFAYKLGTMVSDSTPDIIFKMYLDGVPKHLLQGSLKDYLFIFYEYHNVNHKLLSVVDLGKR